MDKVKTMLSDGITNKLSFKRIITLFLVLVLVVILVGHVFFDKKIDQFMYDGLTNIIVWSMGFIGSEKVADVIKSKMGNSGLV